jgi:hypothetical protein
MNNYIKEKTALAIFCIGSIFFLNIEIALILLSSRWLSHHLFMWSLWCFFSTAFISWIIFNIAD